MKPFRSLLMVPAHKERYRAKAFSCNADAVVFDLEDSVPIDKKEEALEGLRAFLYHRTRPVPCFVRINPDSLLYEWQNLHDRVDGLMIPKIKFKAPRGPKVPTLIVVETPQAVLRLENLLRPHHVIGGVFGVGDFSASMGVIDRKGSVNQRFLYAKQRLAIVARACGKQALDTSFYIKGEGLERTYEQWTEVASWGFTGASPIHPSHVPIANEIFFPSRQDIQWSEEILRGTDQSRGEVWVEPTGYVVGPPHVKQAEHTLARY